MAADAPREPAPGAPPVQPHDLRSLALWTGLLSFARLCYLEAAGDYERAALRLANEAHRRGVRWDGDGR